MAGGKCIKREWMVKRSIKRKAFIATIRIQATYWSRSLEGKKKETFIWRLKVPMSKRVLCLGISDESRARNCVWYAITVQTVFSINLLCQVVSWYPISRAILCSMRIYTEKKNYNTQRNRSEGGEALKSQNSQIPMW